MPDITNRLVNCFQTVFPDLPEGDVATASQQSLAAWDSVASVTMANVIEEEFQLEIDFDDLADLDSFERIREYLDKRVAV